MPTIDAKFDFTDPFPVITKAVNELAIQAVREAAKVGGAKAAQVASERQGESGQMGNIRVSSPIGSSDGWEASFISPVFYAWFQNYGTLGQRSKPLKNPTRRKLAAPKGSGIKPLYFLNEGKHAGERRMFDIVQYGLRTL